MIDFISILMTIFPATSVSCPADMVHVTGHAHDASTDYGEALQDMSCTSWLSTTFPQRCAEFDRDAWLSRAATIKTRSMDFCIDRYEYPNIEDVPPLTFVTYLHAQELCESHGRRLCTEEEWTFACEGEEGKPYPYGYVRSSDTCNIDKPWIAPDLGKLFGPVRPKVTNDELERLWQGVPSGEMRECTSPFGVHDMTGNVDEWTTSVRKSGLRSILKGGYWATVRDRCRPSTRIHNEWHRNYQTGFRCCH